MNQPAILVSLIIPVRHHPATDRREMLNATLTGLPRRADLEVLVIDDHSSLPYDLPDLAPLRLRRLALPATERGAGAARNHGIQAAQGAWLIFLDSDDGLDITSLDQLLAGMARGDYGGYDGLMVRAQSFLHDQPDQAGDRHLFVNRKLDQALAFGDMASLVRLPACWARVVRRQFLIDHGVRFSHAPLGEDVDFAVDFALARPRVTILPLTLPQIRQGNGSLTQKIAPAQLEAILRLKRAANRRLRHGGLGRWQYLLPLDIWALARRAPWRLIRLYTFGG